MNDNRNPLNHTQEATYPNETIINSFLPILVPAISKLANLTTTPIDVFAGMGGTPEWRTQIPHVRTLTIMHPSHITLHARVAASFKQLIAGINLPLSLSLQHNNLTHARTVLPRTTTGRLHARHGTDVQTMRVVVRYASLRQLSPER
jgi:hypothetical protein